MLWFGKPPAMEWGSWPRPMGRRSFLELCRVRGRLLGSLFLEL